MKISELIEHLTALKVEHGDVEVYFSTTGNPSDGNDYPIEPYALAFAEEILPEKLNIKSDYHWDHQEALQAELNEKARPPRIIIGY